jgi:hypothetical protein
MRIGVGVKFGVSLNRDGARVIASLEPHNQLSRQEVVKYWKATDWYLTQIHRSETADRSYLEKGHLGGEFNTVKRR